MDTRTLCLAVLTDGPASGYEIKKAFEEHFGYFLDVSHGAIYPALADMREQGLVECEEVRQTRKPDKKIYRLTEAGRHGLTEGLTRSPGRHRVRSEFVALLIFSEFLPAARIRELIDARLDEWRGMRELAQCPPDSLDEARSGVHFAMGLCDAILRAGIDYLEHNRGWLESSLREDAASKGGEVNTKSYVIAFVLAGVIGLWMASGYLVGDSQGSVAEDNAGEAPAVQPMTVEVRSQAAQRVSRRLEAQGEALANRRVTLRGETAGRVTEIKVERGAAVEAGQPLVQLAMNDRHARLEQARALVAQREADFQAAERLGRDGFQSESQRRQAFAALQAARAELESIEEDIANTTIRAPFDGRVEDRMVELGDYIRVGESVAVVVDNDPLRVRVDIAQQQIRKLSPGAKARVALATGDTLDGKVSYISPRASGGTHTFPVEITVANPDALPAGVSATVTLPLETEWAHFISPALLALNTDGTLGAKTVTDDGRVRFNAVSILRSERDGVWVTGLPEQARIITRGQGFVRDGEPVEAVTAAESELEIDPAAGERPAVTGEG